MSRHIPYLRHPHHPPPMSVEQELRWLHRRVSLLTGLSVGTVVALVGWFLWIGHC